MPEAVSAASLAPLLREGASQGRLPFLTVSSSSMRPLLRPGDEVGLEGVAPQSLRRGDIVLFKGDDAFITHRYWGSVQLQGAPHLVTRGDRSLSFDRPWPAEQLVGRVIVRRRGRGALSLRRGAGARLATHLGAVSALEAGLFAGCSPNPLAPQEQPRWLGARLARNPHDLPARLLRRTFFLWGSILEMAATGAGYISRRSQPLLLLVAFFALLLALLAAPRRGLATADLVDFYAESGNDSIPLVWVTANELDNEGFNLWRGSSCDSNAATQLNQELIASKVDGQALGATYEFEDDGVEPGQVYNYRLESIDINGASRCHQELPLQASLGNASTSGEPTPTASGTITVSVSPTVTLQPESTPALSTTVAPPTATASLTPTLSAGPPPSATPPAAATGADEGENSGQLPSATPSLPGGAQATASSSQEAAVASPAPVPLLEFEVAEPAGEASSGTTAARSAVARAGAEKPEPTAAAPTRLPQAIGAAARAPGRSPDQPATPVQPALAAAVAGGAVTTFRLLLLTPLLLGGLFLVGGGLGVAWISMKKDGRGLEK